MQAIGAQARLRLMSALGIGSNKMLICPLCMNEVMKFHKRSHLIPEWMYAYCYDEKHKIIEVSRLEERATRKQKGVYSSFMCEDCEAATQKYDRYASLILSNRSPDTIEYKSIKRQYTREKYNGKELEFGKWENIDFRLLQKFIFSIILRTHYAGRIEGPIFLNKNHLEKIQAIYKDESNLDDSSYPITIAEYSRDDKLRDHVVLPYIKKSEGHHVIEFTGGGYAFNVYVSNHSKPRHVRSLSLKKDGSVYLIITFFQDTGLYKNSKKLIDSLKIFPRDS